MAATITTLNSELLKCGWGEAIELVMVLNKQKKAEFDKWLAEGSTVKLREMAEDYRTWSIYGQRNDKLPFENDVDAIDSAWLHLQ